MPLYQLKNKINVFKTLEKKKNKLIKEQLFKSYIKLFILCNKFKDYRLVDNNLNIITDKEKYLNNENLYEKRKNIDIKMINIKTKEYFFVCCRFYDEEQLLKSYNLAEMHYQVNQYKQFQTNNYKNIHRNEININNDIIQDDSQTENSDNEPFYEPDEIHSQQSKSEISQSINKPKYKLGLFVKSKQEFIKKYNNSKSYYLMSIIDPEEDVYDYQYFLNIANSFEFKDFMLKTNKKEIVLRNYQQDIINQIQLGNNILNVCSNIGTHFILSDFIFKNEIKNILILDTKTKWDKIFENYYGFDDYNVKYIENNNDLIFIDKNIFFISKISEKYKFLSKYNFDLVISNISYDKITFNFINKLKTKYNIFISHQNLNIENINIINFNFNKLKYYELRNHWKVFDEVDKYPNQIIIHPDFKDKKYTDFIQEMNSDNINFDKLFEIKSNKSTLIDKFISSFISNKEFTDNQNTIYEKLYNINYNLVNNKDSQIWVLPKKNFNINANLLINILQKDYHYKYFNYLIIDNTLDIDTINNQLLEKENNIQKHYYKGFIILTNGILDNNIVIKNCSSVVFLHNNITYNEYEAFLNKCLNNHNNIQNFVIIGFNTDIYQLLYNFNDGIHTFVNNTNKITYIVKNNLFYINKNPYILKTLKKLEQYINEYKPKLSMYKGEGDFNINHSDDNIRKEQIELKNQYNDLEYKESEYKKIKSKFYDVNSLIEEILSY